MIELDDGAFRIGRKGWHEFAARRVGGLLAFVFGVGSCHQWPWSKELPTLLKRYGETDGTLFPKCTKNNVSSDVNLWRKPGSHQVLDS
jgi:hypothetical protein